MTTDPLGSHGVDADRLLAHPLFASLTRHEAEEFVRYCEVRRLEAEHPDIAATLTRSMQERLEG